MIGISCKSSNFEVDLLISKSNRYFWFGFFSNCFYFSIDSGKIAQNDIVTRRVDEKRVYNFLHPRLYEISLTFLSGRDLIPHLTTQQIFEPISEIRRSVEKKTTFFVTAR